MGRRIEKNNNQVLSKGPLKQITLAVFAGGGPKIGNLTMTTSTVTARRKGDPQQYVEGNMQLTTSHKHINK